MDFRNCGFNVKPALANIMFYMLLKRSGALFASMVTYGIPLVAVVWGIFYGEHITLLQVLSMMVILVGVYLANISKRKTSIGDSESLKNEDIV